MGCYLLATAGAGATTGSGVVNTCSKAAVSASAVPSNKVLQHCELQLGMPLFERVRGKLYPKPEAHRLFVETEKLNRD